MRRKNLEVTDIKHIDEIMKSCECCRLGFSDGDFPYIVPLNFGFEREQDKVTIYFHGAKEGRKIDLINKNKLAAFEMDTNHKLHTHEKACGHSYRYQSVIGGGKISLVSDFEEKSKAMNIIMNHLTGKGDWQFDEKMLNPVAIIKLEVSELSCKEHE